MEILNLQALNNCTYLIDKIDNFILIFFLLYLTNISIKRY